LAEITLLFEDAMIDPNRGNVKPGIGRRSVSSAMRSWQGHFPKIAGLSYPFKVAFTKANPQGLVSGA
jgi:hypothetical protein